MYELHSGMLKMYEEFTCSDQKIEITYEVGKDPCNIVQLYHLDEIAGDKNEYSKITNILNWVSTHIKHNGQYDGHLKNTAKELFAYALDTDEGINCRSLSMILMECLLAIGIKVRVVYMFSCSPYDFDNHVVCEAWVSELHKWIMIDPTYNGIVLDEQNNPLNIKEIRSALANRVPLHFKDGLNYNSEEVTDDEVLDYYSKDMFWFTIRDLQGYDNENREEVHVLSIVPKNFDLEKYETLNIEYRVSCWENLLGNTFIEEFRKQIGKGELTIVSLESIY